MDCVSRLTTTPVNKSALVFCIIMSFNFLVDAQVSKSIPLEIVGFVARKSTDKNEFKNKADWIDLKNTGSTKLNLPEFKVFLTDKGMSDPFKFELPQKTLAPGETWRIWCDGENVYANQIHSNFRLSKKGEALGLYYQENENKAVPIDVWNYTKLSNKEKGKEKINGKIVPILIIQE